MCSAQSLSIRRESSKRNYYITSPRVIIKAIIIIVTYIYVLLRVYRYVTYPI